MKYLTLIWLLLACASIATGQSHPDIRDELLAMLERDQAARFKCTGGTADEQLKCLAKIGEEIDKPITARLNEIYAKLGFPNTSMVGKDGFQALVVLLQHVRDTDLRKKSEVGMARAFEDKILLPMQYAGFIDRLLIDQGKPQRYGSNFQMKDGKFVMTPVEDLKMLDERRKALGLPPIAEYAKGLKEMYKLEVVIPPLN